MLRQYNPQKILPQESHYAVIYFTEEYIKAKKSEWMSWLKQVMSGFLDMVIWQVEVGLLSGQQVPRGSVMTPWTSRAPNSSQDGSSPTHNTHSYLCPGVGLHDKVFPSLPSTVVPLDTAGRLQAKQSRHRNPQKDALGFSMYRIINLRIRERTLCSDDIKHPCQDHDVRSLAADLESEICP